MQQETLIESAEPLQDRLPCFVYEDPLHSDTAALIRDIRRAAKRRRRLAAWITPLVAAGMFTTIFIFSRFDIRLGFAIFAVCAGIIAFVLAREAYKWETLAAQAGAAGDVRAIGPLLTILNNRDSSACDSIEQALIVLLPRVERLSQLSRTARNELNRLLLGFEMPGLRGGHNAELARAALETVARFRDCYALPAVRRLADGFTATRPAAAIRDLANDILPDLEERAVLLRPARSDARPEQSYLRPVGGPSPERHAASLLRPAAKMEAPEEPPSV